MPKQKTVYKCSVCGGVSPKWSGQCPFCGEWNCMEETVEVAVVASKKPTVAPSGKAVPLSSINPSDTVRIDTGSGEFNRVLGGGLVPGSVVLLSGDPGIGKSTLLLQACEHISGKVLYVTGEESYGQIKLRADRLKIVNENLTIMCETNVLAITEYIVSNLPSAVVIDSIQTMFHLDFPSSPGTVTQVRECTCALLRTAKEHNIPIIIVGHINKGGEIAGPKVMEHIVDTVLYFEGDKQSSYRILRAQKNRFGSTNEIGVFEMQSEGLSEVDNPSALMLSGRLSGISGSAVVSVLEGSRPMFVEVQALCTPTSYGNAKRNATGYEYNRLGMILAVMEKRAGLGFSSFDVFLNVVGGLSLNEPAADLAIVAALYSAISDQPVDDGLCLFGEIGLSGEIRAVPSAVARVNEAARLGFNRCILPKGCYKQLINFKNDGIEIIYVRTIKELFKYIK
ncbi:MAG: DNA repair protein RadA [Oscillospiraceae bacterium]|nr:DNA repair protein RadA [Candidatus Equicaccousia limihippi]